MTTDKTAVIAISDLHINSTVSLIAPTVALDDGGEYRASREQRRLWEWFTDFCAWAKDSTEGYRRIVVICGDVGELDTKRRTNQLITTNKATIQSAVLKTLEPFLSLLDGLIVIRGTPAHVGKDSWLEEWLASDCDITIGNHKTRSHYHYQGKAAGVRFDIAHHVNMGNLAWTEKGAAVRLGAQTVMEYARMGEQVPNVVVRGHVHRWSIDDNYGLQVVIMPSWTWATEYIYRLGKYNGIADIGGGLWLCQEGQYEWRKREYIIPKAVKRIWAAEM
jgi:hypothetical protein